MKLTYYLNKSDSRYVDKDITQIVLEDHSNPVTIQLLEETSLANPTFKMKDVDIYMTANYCYVDSLRRYYFINNIRLSNGYAYLDCTCDVLMTYKQQLRAQECIIKRQRNKYDLFQNDGELPIKQYPATRCIGKFTSPFSMSTNNYIMGVVGNKS